MDEEQFLEAAKRIGEAQGGFGEAMDFKIVSTTLDEVVITFEVGHQHLQPYGIVHGGVYCAIVEAACSIGAALYAYTRDQGGAVGIENHTSFLKAVRTGHVTAIARPSSRGRRLQMWICECRNEQDELLATGTVRMMCLEKDAKIAGKEVKTREAGD